MQNQTKSLPWLVTGEQVVIQNQTGNYPRRWDKTGTILEPKGFDQYRVITDGSRRITLRNRRFLRKIVTPEERARTQIPILDDVTEERGIGDDTTQAQEDTTNRIGEQVMETGQETADTATESQEYGEAQTQNEEGTVLRRSSRSNKGLTTGYDDFLT